jgi:hypothetical protein
MTSKDGITWVPRTTNDNIWRSVCWSVDLTLFCAVASSGTGNRVMTSPDGVTWTTRNNPVDNDWTSVCWSSQLGIFCAVASSGTGDRIMTSKDGITWRTRKSPSDNRFSSVCWSPELNIFCSVSNSVYGIDKALFMTSYGRNISSNTTNDTSILETNSISRVFLPTRLTESDKKSIVNPTEGMIV